MPASVLRRHIGDTRKKRFINLLRDEKVLTGTENPNTAAFRINSTASRPFLSETMVRPASVFPDKPPCSLPASKLPQKQHILHGNNGLAPVFSDIPFLVVVPPRPGNRKKAVGKLRVFDIFALGADLENLIFFTPSQATPDSGPIP